MVAFEELGVMNPDGMGAVVSGMAGVYYLQWVTEEEAKIIGNQHACRTICKQFSI